MWMLKAFSLLAVTQAQIAPTQTMLRKAVLQKANSLLNSTVDDTLSCVSSCPLDGSSLSPSPLCLLSNCTSTLAKCLFSSTCRNGLMCELHCTEPLAKTEDGLHFATLMECVRVKCPGFPPSKSCVALHCTEEAAECAIHSKCRHALECANGCVPAKYEAALQLVQENTAVAV